MVVEQKPIEVHEPIEVILHDALVSAFIEWLSWRGLVLIKFEARTDDHLEQYMVIPKEL
jgi:hypothetical protein